MLSSVTVMQAYRFTTLSPELVTVPPPKEVQTHRAFEVDAEQVGVEQRGVEQIWNAVLRLYQTGLHPAIALCIRRRGQVIIDRSVGHIWGNGPNEAPGAIKAPATPDSLYNLFSASKSVTAMLIHLLDDRGQLHLDDAVVEYIPEFAGHSKRWITIRHVLTHRSGIPVLPPGGANLDLLTHPDRIVELLSDSKPTSRPGRRLAYHALTGGFILAEIIERVTGKDIRNVLRQEVLDPLGFKHFNYGVAPQEIDQVARHSFTGAKPRWPYSELLRRAIGVGIEEAVELSNDQRYITGVVPAGNIISTPNEASRFFQLLLNEGEMDGVRIFSPRTVRRAISEQSYFEADATLLLPIRYGMGFMLGSKFLSLYGPNTRYAFGHLGFTNLLVWADRERDISVAFMTSGKPFITPRLLRWYQVMLAISRKIPRDSLS